MKQIALIAGFVLLVWTGYSAWSIASYAAYSGERRADGIIVLGAAPWGNRPSPVFRERINHAIRLYREGYASTIIFTGGGGGNNMLAESEVAQQYAIKQGVALDDILVETLSKTTEENLYYAQQLAIDHHLTSLIIVSDPLHMKRAMLIAEDLGLTAYSAPTPTTRYRSFDTKLRFLVRETLYYQRYQLYRMFCRYPMCQVGLFQSIKFSIRKD